MYSLRVLCRQLGAAIVTGRSQVQEWQQISTMEIISCPTGVAMAADTKRLKGQEIMKDSYLTHQATSFAGRLAEQRLEEAQRVRYSPAATTAMSCLALLSAPLAGRLHPALFQAFEQRFAQSELQSGENPNSHHVLQVCETLDRRRGIPESPMWLVEPPLQEQDAAAEAAEEADPGAVNPWAELLVADRLSDVLQRLRMEYSYCIFCGCQVRSKCFTRCSAPPLKLLTGIAPRLDGADGAWCSVL